MVGRQWTVAVGGSRAAEFEAFARETALPMVRGKMGCASVMILREPGADRYTFLSLWVSRKAMQVAFGSPEWEHIEARLEEFGADLKNEPPAQFETVAFFVAGEKPDAPGEPRGSAP